MLSEEAKQRQRKLSKLWKLANPDKLKAQRTRYNKSASHKRARRRYHLKVTYGVSESKYNEMSAAQHDKCAICDSNKKLYVDHDHSSGKVRGLLCNRCNLKLGIIEDSEFVAKANKYLTNFKEINNE
ncbi:MAG TPA: endonuclease VII domain-containing protein [Anaerovoracaceae bacterium]|nr:endonuclease VII domain-containing protein [Anaerovoracaceae bacterium]